MGGASAKVAPTKAPAVHAAAMLRHRNRSVQAQSHQQANRPYQSFLED
jgi:hypothetical protein